MAGEVNLGLASWKFERSNPSAVELPGKAPWENGARRDGYKLVRQSGQF